MIPWNKRVIEVKALLNPAFCGEILRRCIRAYEKASGKGMPYPLVYLVLPLILHNKTNSKMGLYKEIGLIVWIQNNEHLLIDFATRARRLIPITKESLVFLLRYNTLEISENSNLSVKNYQSHQDDNDNYTEKYYLRADLLGEWLARAGSPTTIYSIFGVTP